MVDRLVALIGSLNASRILELIGTPVAPLPGLVATTSGGVVSVAVDVVKKMPEPPPTFPARSATLFRLTEVLMSGEQR